MPVYPVKLTSSTRKNSQRAAEVRLYDSFAENLPDDYTAIYSAEWICNFKGRNQQDLVDPLTGERPGQKIFPLGEIDFILVTPKCLIVLEVKGGRVFSEGGTWYSIDRNDVRHAITDPLAQARRNMFAVLETLKNGRRFYDKFIPAGYGAILPQTVAWQENIATQNLFLFSEHMNVSLIRKLKEIVGFWTQIWKDYDGSYKGLNNDDIKHIVSVFAPTTELKKRKLMETIEEFQEEVFTLTENQLDVLKGLAGNRKAIITGGAGTGKTLLAMEKARQTAMQGHKTLFTCFNRFLSINVKDQLGNVENLEVMNFHKLCYEWGIKAGFENLSDPDELNVGVPQKDYYREVLPNVLLEAAESLYDRFDAVIIDEAQEMSDNYWIALQSCLNDDDPIFYIFCDPNQSIWHLENCLPSEWPTFHLSKNLRNSLLIFKNIKRLCTELEYEAGCTYEGKYEIILFEEGEGQLEIKLVKLLSYLVRQGISLKDIVIITGKSRENSMLSKRKKIDNYPITLDLDNKADQVLFTSARRYRGMEAPIVIMIEVDGITDLHKLQYELRDRLDLTEDDHRFEKIAKETLLIGMSRAQHSLYIIADADTVKSLEKLGLGTN